MHITTEIDAKSGALMARNVGRIDWDDYTEALPSFLILVGIPFSYSIGDGLTLGFIAYPVLKILAGRGREASWPLRIIGLVLLLYLVLVRSRL